MQGQQVVSDGIGRAAETEEDIDARAAREYVKHPDGLLKLDSELMTGIQRYDVLWNSIKRDFEIHCVHPLHV